MKAIISWFIAFIAIIQCSAARTYKISSQKASPQTGSQYCENTYGTSLATVITAEDKTELRNAMTTAGKASDHVWIGLNDRGHEGDFEWDDGSTCGTNLCIDYWNPGEPNESGGAEDCTEVWYSAGQIRANDLSCDYDDKYFACNIVDCVLGDWYNDGECSTFCGTGTQDQVRDIVTAAQHGGAACGSQTQTISCNEHECCPNGIDTFDWDRMTGTNENVPTYENFVFNVESTDLTLNIYVELPYLGKTSANHQREAKFGTTYVIDFEDFDAHKDAINEPGTCQNRMSDSFTGKTFNDFWSYSDEPQNPNGIGSINTLAYPPSDKWTMYMKEDGCDTIVYERSFTWQELRDCSGFGGNIPFTSLDHEDDDNKYELSGTFYINVVSPFWYNSDFGYYRVYQLLSQPFVISVSSVVNVLGSTGINLITMWIIAVYKESQEAGQYTEQQDFRLVVMTETAEYMTLTRNTNSIFNFVKDGSNNNVNSGIFTVGDTPEAGCLNNRDYICTQLWRIDALNPGCSDELGMGTDFSGNYELGFTPQCKDTNDEHCNNFLDKHNIRDNVLIDADLTWRDDICDPKVFELQFIANMLFYEEGNQFVTPISDTHLFQAGVDTIYVEIDTTFPDNTFTIFNTVLTNVWICTFAPNIIPGSFEDVIDGTIQLNEMGCLNSGKDSSLSNIVNDIYPIPTNDIVNFQIHNEAESNIIQFSFLIPEEVTRDTLYIHAQIEVELQEPITRRRRRMLLDVNTANQISHFGEQIGISNNKNNKKPQPQLPVNNIPNPSSTIYLSLKSTWVIVIGSLLALILTFNICFMCYMNCSKNKRGKKGYEKVKIIDSEFDSEAQMLDNQ